MTGNAGGRGPGRPAFPDGTANNLVFAIKLSAQHLSELKEAAISQGKPPSQWAREVLLKAAQAEARRRG